MAVRRVVPMQSNSVEIRPIAGALGAEIAGVDLSEDLDDGMIAAIRRAWLDHLVIFFRGQELPPARFLAFARHFGEAVEYPFIERIDGFREIAPVVKLEHERVNFGGLWHSETTYLGARNSRAASVGRSARSLSGTIAVRSTTRSTTITAGAASCTA